MKYLFWSLAAAAVFCLRSIFAITDRLGASPEVFGVYLRSIDWVDPRAAFEIKQNARDWEPVGEASIVRLETYELRRVARRPRAHGWLDPATLLAAA